MEQSRHIFKLGLLILILGILFSGWVFQKNITAYWFTPKYQLNILFSHHLLATDLSLASLKEKIRQSDLYLMEYPAWDDAFETELNNISQGTESPTEFFSSRQITEEALQNNFQFQNLQLEALYQSKVFVTSVDLHADDNLAIEIQQLLPTMEQLPLRPDFNEMLRVDRKQYEHFMGLQIKREQFMVDQLIALENKIKNGNISALKRKSDIKILFVLGSNHVKVYDLLKKQGVNVTKEFSHTPYTYDYAGEITVKFLSGQEVSDQLLARGLFQTELVTLFGAPWLDDEEKYAKLVRSIISPFTFAETKNIFTNMAQSANPEKTFRQEVTQLAKKKNIIIPMTRQDFDNLVL